MNEFWMKVGKTLHHCGCRLLHSIRGVWWDVHHPPVKKPLFIVGCSRAGTTLVYKTISQAKELGTLNRETHDFWADLHPLSEKNWNTHALTAADARQRDRDIVSRYFYVHTGKYRFVDKNNQNSLCIPYLHALFPDAYFLYVKRNPGDNINSLIEGWGKVDLFGTWSSSLPATVAIEKGQYQRWCFFLPEDWRDYLTASIEEVCAFQYSAVNHAIIKALNNIPASQWTEICYEDILQNPIEAFRQAFEEIGLSFDSRLENHCSHVLSNPYNAFFEIRVDKWRNAKHCKRVERVLPSLKKIANEMGYMA